MSRKGLLFHRLESGTAAPHAKARSGVTLIEVVLAMLILVIMVIMLVSSLRHPRFMVVSSADKQAAIHAANEALEEAFAMGYNYCNSNYLAVGSAVLLDTLEDHQYSMNDLKVSAQWSVEDWNGQTPPILLIRGIAEYHGGDAPVVVETLIGPGG